MIGAWNADGPSWTCRISRFCAVFSAIAFASCAAASAAPVVSNDTAADDGGAGDNSAIPPRILSPLDASHYAAAFALQEEGNWRSADSELSNLHDRLLVGTVMAQRFLSPHYQTRFDEAREWLAQYADQPEARAVWTLAKRKAPNAVVSSPSGPAQASAPSDGSEIYGLPAEPGNGDLRRPWLFEAGLAAWRGHRWLEAARAFETAASARNNSSWYAAASSFWAARARLVLGDTNKVDALFEAAASQPRTFYGLLARETLGMDGGVKSGRQPLSSGDQAELEAVPGGKRALALLQVGETERAEAELRVLANGGSSALANAIVALADLANMPSLCLAMREQAPSDAAGYPVPRWQPQNGFSVDRALIFALTLQESRFNTGIHSGAGAAGLMQLMPQTAKSVAKSAGIPLNNVSDLVDPVLNLSLGQEYVKELIRHEQVNGNLILLLAAYNNGPGPLAGWEKRAGRDDPLLFIEGLPNQETRLYVERVLTNLWIYRQRLGQKLPDLAALAANRWPTYVSMETSSEAPIQNAAAR